MPVVSAEAEKPFNFSQNTLWQVLRAGKSAACKGIAQDGKGNRQTNERGKAGKHSFTFSVRMRFSER
jgi:hypothetical protein